MRKVYLREFKCPDCGTFMRAAKHRLTEKGHIKTMWCPMCKEERDFVQVGYTKLLA